LAVRGEPSCRAGLTPVVTGDTRNQTLALARFLNDALKRIAQLLRQRALDIGGQGPLLQVGLHLQQVAGGDCITLGIQGSNFCA
jgi:hypothetical protein